MLKSDANPVMRLSDMLVKEVSLVDRAANKRKFLMLKALTKNPDGSFSSASAEAPKVEPASTPDAGGAPPTKPAQATSSVKATVSLTADAKAALTAAVDEMAAMVAEARQVLDAATEVTTEDNSNGAPLAELLMAICEGAEDAAYTLVGVPAADEATPATAPAEAGPDGDSVPVAAAEFSKRLQLRKALRLVRKFEGYAVGASALAKIGAKMKKSRLERVRAAMKILAEVMGELEDGAKKPAQAEAEAKKAEAKKSELSKSIADMEAQLEALRKKVGSSNATPVERVEKVAPTSQRVTWPVDMGDPR